jgi:signal transduction histidine kinase
VTAPAPLPPNEAARLEALRSYRILDTGPEEGFDALVRLAGAICETPISLVSLVDESRQWFKARMGLDAKETPRDVAFCAHSILGTSAMVVPDATLDPRFKENPLVTDQPGVRFYAGQPLVTRDGHALGTLCVIDRVPRNLSSFQREALSVLGQAVVDQMELRRQLAEIREEVERRRAAERELLDKSKELSASNAELARGARLKDEFLAAMSHELRTPLNAILGLSEALHESVYGALNEAQTQAVVTVEESGRHLLQLINDILDLSKVQAGRLELDLESCDVAVLCQGSVRLVRESAQQKHQRLSVSIDPLVREARLDARRFKQVLVNLLANAVKFTPQGGSIGLDVTADPDAETISFSVWDSGIGIAPDQMPRLFQPFVQFDSGRAREHAGTGLGLSLVRRLVELHGGGIAVESALKQGSRFTVTVPLPSPLAADLRARSGETPRRPTSDAVQTAPANAPGRPRRILLAEDHEINIATFEPYLVSRGYVVAVARDGAEAVARARELRPDLIIMDIQMPKVDGIEAMRQVRSDPALARTPIIAVTALAMPGDREMCLAAGADDYLSKPVRLKELAASVAALLHVPQK